MIGAFLAIAAITVAVAFIWTVDCDDYLDNAEDDDGEQ